MKINWKEVAVFCGAIFLPMIIIRILFVIPAPCEFFDSEWKEGDVLTYISTMVLSWIAVYQNKKVNDINDRMLHIEESQITPNLALFNLKNSDYEEVIQHDSLVCTLVGQDNHVCFSKDGHLGGIYHDRFLFKIKNVSKVDIIQIIPNSLRIEYLSSNDDVICTYQYNINVNCADHSLMEKQSMAFVLGTDDIWTELVSKNGDKLKMIFDFNIHGQDGSDFDQSIEICMVNAEINDNLSPVIVSQKVHKPKRKA